MPFPNWIGGHHRLWTREKVVAALAAAAREINGPLPCSDDTYLVMKRGRFDWPSVNRIYEYFGAISRAWLAAGAPIKRVRLKNIRWLPEEEEYLLDHAGIQTLEQIARKLGRSYQAVRARLNKNYRIQSRHNQGFFSASDLAKEFNCPYHRIRRALAAGRIRGRYDRRRNRWQVDVTRLSECEKAIMKAPKKTHRNEPTDLGDYYRRHGLKRTILNGRVVVVPA